MSLRRKDTLFIAFVCRVAVWVPWGGRDRAGGERVETVRRSESVKPICTLEILE